MELKEILAISGQPGLYRYVAQSTRGVIVESLLDGRRMNASASAKVSALSEISIFTEGDDIPLAAVFTKIYEHTGGKEAISHKEDPEKLKASFAEVLPAGQSGKMTAFGVYEKLAEPGYGGLDDLSAGFRANYTRDALLLEIEVSDNVFHQSESAIAEAWRGDGIQLAFQSVGAPFAVRTEIDAALIDGKPVVMIRAAQGNRSRLPQCRIERKGARTVYHLTIPAPLLGVKAFEPGAMLTGSLLVNDNDGKGRKGFLSWGGGIGINKDPGMYNLFILK